MAPTLSVSDVILLDLRNFFCQLLQPCMCIPAKAAENLWSDEPNALLKNQLASKCKLSVLSMGLSIQDQRKKLKSIVSRISKTLSWQSNATVKLMHVQQLPHNQLIVSS
jgi:hypothetical protein